MRSASRETRRLNLLCSSNSSSMRRTQPTEFGLIPSTTSPNSSCHNEPPSDVGTPTRCQIAEQKGRLPLCVLPRCPRRTKGNHRAHCYALACSVHHCDLRRPHGCANRRLHFELPLHV